LPVFSFARSGVFNEAIHLCLVSRSAKNCQWREPQLSQTLLLGERDAPTSHSRTTALAGTRALLSSQFGSAPKLDVLDPGHRQVIEATLICLEAIGGTKPHSVIAMEYEAK
jgi:hypothetical protein